MRRDFRGIPEKIGADGGEKLRDSCAAVLNEGISAPRAHRHSGAQEIHEQAEPVTLVAAELFTGAAEKQVPARLLLAIDLLEGMGIRGVRARFVDNPTRPPG